MENTGSASTTPATTTTTVAPTPTVPTTTHSPTTTISLAPITVLSSNGSASISSPYEIPDLSGWYGRPILFSFRPCWHSHLGDTNEEITAIVMGVSFILIISILAEGIRSLREALEAGAVLVVSHNTVDVNAQGTIPVSGACDPNDKECIQVVEEVVSPIILARFSCKHITNSLLYGLQCCLQLLVLFGVLSLHLGLIAAALLGVFLGRLMFHWRPRHSLRRMD